MSLAPADERSPDSAEDTELGEVSTTRSLDLGHLDLQTFGDVGLQRELLALFEQQCDALMPLIHSDRPCDERARAAHSLRGAAAAIGAFDVASVGADVEASFIGHDQVQTHLVAAMDRAVEAARCAIAEWRIGHPV